VSLTFLEAFEADKTRVAAALRVIANQRGNDFTLQRAAASMESGTGEAALDIGEAYNRLQMPERNVPDETVLAYYQSLSGGAPAGSKDSYTEALRVIALDRQSNFLLRKLNDPNADVQVTRSATDEPVGLDNIGNTCYLNSLLQFYYTIKSVREVVMNIQTHRMDLNDPKTDDDIRRKRVGGRKVVRSEIIKAQKCKLSIKLQPQVSDLK
jgi:ubiquitin carboxyl-terminal hydrolase 25/28